MIKLAFRLGCLAVIAAVAFLVVAFMSGGEKFRWFGDKAGGVLKKGTDELGEKADSVKEAADSAKKKFEKWTSTDEDDRKR